MNTSFESQMLTILQLHILRVHEAILNEEDLLNTKVQSLYRLLLSLMRQHRTISRDLKAPGADSLDMLLAAMPQVSSTESAVQPAQKPQPPTQPKPPAETTAPQKNETANHPKQPELATIGARNESNKQKRNIDYDDYDDR